MLRYALLTMLLLVVSVACAAPTLTVNGKPTTVSAMDINGKAYIDIVALMQLLGGTVAYDPATGRIDLTTAGAPAPPTGTGAAVPLADFGTPQLPGDDGRIGQVYKLRSGNPLYFRLNSAEYTVGQLRFGDAIAVPKADEKLLVLHYSVQNPQKTELLYRFDSLKFTAVDAMNVNHDDKDQVGDEQTKETLNMRLKPSQRIEAYTCLVVPAKGVIPKLMVMPPGANDGPILRYDLRNLVTPLPAPIADPADPTGATALETVPAQLKTPYPLRYFDVTVEGTETVTTALDAAAPKNGDSYFVVTLTCRNKAVNETLLRYDTLVPTLTDVGGQELQRHNQLLAAMANSGFSQKVKPDAEVTVRYYFTVPKDDKLKTLAIREATSRTYEYDVSQP